MPLLQVENQIEKKKLFVITNSKSFISVDDEVDVLLCNASGGKMTVNIPPAANIPGKEYVIKKIDGTNNEVWVSSIAKNGELFDGVSPLILSTQYKAYRFVSDGTNFQIIGEV